jgi:FkbM family methyltransferase
MYLDHGMAASTFLDVVQKDECGVHFSQFGECCILTNVFFNGVRGGTYVDVGCHDPFRYSNTYLLWKVLGWTGINIDADARSIEKFRQHRPHDVNLHCGVGSEAGELEFLMFSDGAVNTFDPEFAAHMAPRFGAPAKVKVPVRRINDILDEHLSAGRKIDYLNVDCEGMDHEIIASFDFDKHRPRIISVELGHIDVLDIATSPTVPFLYSKGYRLHSFLHITGVFVAG